MCSKKCVYKTNRGKQTGLACISIGGGREVKEDKIDLSVGFQFHKKVGDYVKKRKPYFDDPSQ